MPEIKKIGVLEILGLQPYLSHRLNGQGFTPKPYDRTIVFALKCQSLKAIKSAHVGHINPIYANLKIFYKVVLTVP